MPALMNPPEPGTDAPNLELIRSALRGDEQAFEEVIRLFSRRLYALAYAILQDAAESEDVVQDAFVTAHRSSWRLRDPAKFPAWLAMVARNRARDILRKRCRQSARPAEDQEEKLLQDPQAPQPSGQLEQGERERIIRLLLASLPEQWRAAVVLRYLEGMDHASIQHHLGLSDGALRGILGRAMVRLRQQAKSQLGELRN
jgi:RNA polymerase sigma-70 factor (ECF subfamily)